jgi:predicted amidohydrolase
MKLRVAAYQMCVTGDIAANAAAITAAARSAHDQGADILLTPEGSLSGYTPEFDPLQVREALTDVTAAARELGIGLALGTCFEEDDGLIYNQLRFYARQGAYLGAHCKILRCGSLATPSVGEINHYATQPLRTFQLDGITVGGLICNDLWANPTCTPMPDPHLTQQLAQHGARVVFHAVNGGRDEGAWSLDVHWPYHETNLRMRAQVGKLWIVTADSCNPISLPCSAPTGVLGPDGSWHIRARDQGEDLFVYTIHLS